MCLWTDLTWNLSSLFCQHLNGNQTEDQRNDTFSVTFHWTLFNLVLLEDKASQDWRTFLTVSGPSHTKPHTVECHSVDFSSSGTEGSRHIVQNTSTKIAVEKCILGYCVFSVCPPKGWCVWQVWYLFVCVHVYCFIKTPASVVHLQQLLKETFNTIVSVVYRLRFSVAHLHVFWRI